jgi:hypothetical protein
MTDEHKQAWREWFDEVLERDYEWPLCLTVTNAVGTHHVISPMLKRAERTDA